MGKELDRDGPGSGGFVLTEHLVLAPSMITSRRRAPSC